jgi:hypothetical protein
MRALVVYESMYGNTHAVAVGIAAGLRDTCEVILVPVARATAQLVAAADLLVVGGPTHTHAMSSDRSRQIAAKTASKQDSGLHLDPDAAGPGLRDWLGHLGHREGAGAAFDTRLAGHPVFTGRASRRIRTLLRRHGYHLIAAPESFLVSGRNTLLAGEAERARQWGAALGTVACEAHRPVRA